RRRSRLGPDRADPGLQRRSPVAYARPGVDPGDRLRDPDPDPRLPSAGSAGRTDAGGQLMGGAGRKLAAPAAAWEEQSRTVHRVIWATAIVIVLLALAAADKLRWTGATVLIVIALVVLLWRIVRDGFWPAVDRAGLQDVHGRWSRQPPSVQR